jgi:hypothetical protein
LMVDYKHDSMTNSIMSPQTNSREGFTTQINRMQLEADLHLEGGDVEEYLKILTSIYEKIKNDRRFKKLQYDLSMQFMKYGQINKALAGLTILFDETSRYDDDSPGKTKRLFQFSLDIAN